MFSLVFPGSEGLLPRGRRHHVHQREHASPGPGHRGVRRPPRPRVRPRPQGRPRAGRKEAQGQGGEKGRRPRQVGLQVAFSLEVAFEVKIEVALQEQQVEVQVQRRLQIEVAQQRQGLMQSQKGIIQPFRKKAAFQAYLIPLQCSPISKTTPQTPN